MSKDGDCSTSEQPTPCLGSPRGEKVVLYIQSEHFFFQLVSWLSSHSTVKSLSLCSENPTNVYWRGAVRSTPKPSSLCWTRKNVLLQELLLPGYVTLHLFCLTSGGYYQPSPPIICLGNFKYPFCCQIYKLVLHGLVPRLKSPPHCLFCHV